jgi:ATP-dependent Zn protease
MRQDYAHAIHESAHAIAARVLGLKCNGVNIIRDGTAGGYTEFKLTLRGLRGSCADVMAAKLIVCAMAGPIAQFNLASKANIDVNSRSDIRQVSRLLGHFGKQRQEIEDKMRYRAVQLIEIYQRDICRVARVLVKHKKLSGKQIDRLIRWKRETYFQPS